MTIDEEIKELLYDAECNRADLDIEWAKENEQLAEWLEELKFIRQWKDDIMKSFCKYDTSSFEELVRNVRNKTIDEFVEKIIEYCSMSDMNRKMIKQLAEHMKVQ